MKSFELIQCLVKAGKLDPITDNYPVGFSISASGKILLKFTGTTIMHFESFDDVEAYILDFVSEEFGATK